MNIHNNLKNKNQKTNFSFDLALCTSFMKMGAILRSEGGGGSTYPYLGQDTPLHSGNYLPKNDVFKLAFVQGVY